jgi:predicted ATPase
MQHGAPFGDPDGDAFLSGPFGLPAEWDRLVGREAELLALRGLLGRSRLVTVTGPGGVGKTRLALTAAAAARGAAVEGGREGPQDRFCDGVRLVELSTVRDGRMVEYAVLEALAVTDRSGRPAWAVLAEHLADRELLLVLDGCEYLVAECAALVGELLRRAPGLRILATARRPLGAEGESVLPLGPLEPGEAVRLFARRAAAVAPSFAVTDANRAAVGELCRRLDGLPLALELAAARLRTLPVERIADRLAARFRLLGGGERTALRTAIGWSHELCTPAQRLLWARLSVFAGEFDLDAVEYVCAGSGLPADQVRETVAELVALRVVIRHGERHRMPEAVREYGAGWLEVLGDTERLRRRHRDWYLGLATSCELDWLGPGRAEAAARIGRNLRNLRLALGYALERAADPHIGQYLAGSLSFYWIARGLLPEGRFWLDRALTRPSTNEEAHTKALRALAALNATLGTPTR